MNFSSQKNSALEGAQLLIHTSCKNCAYLLNAASPMDGLRCGYEYFQTPPRDRKVRSLNTYPEVSHQDSCGYWAQKP